MARVEGKGFVRAWSWSMRPAPSAAIGINASAGIVRPLDGPRPWNSAERAKEPWARPGRKFSTSTITKEGRLIPWLASEGPLAYTPESPPSRNYFFQYGWILPGVINPDRVRWRHYYFGASLRDDAREAFAFWEDARMGQVSRVFFKEGWLPHNEMEAPIAVYKHQNKMGQPLRVFIQHGSYQFLPEAEQALLEQGYVTLYRGIQKAHLFRWFRFDLSMLDKTKRLTWSRYVQAQRRILSDSALSFNLIHDRSCRCEAGYLNDRSQCSDQIARECTLEIEKDSFAKRLWNCHIQGFSLARWPAERKFGPNFVVFRTPLTNIRITSFMAGEHEARILDPNKLDLVEAFGCRVEQAQRP